ncbi:HdeD family acid-resistance protein [Streptomyces mirabilis]|uniref:HdeD family acid-resistance protein n=1 Tax=Streptomyces mirabilis TaxID=68239 RepID=UPI00331AD104
MPKSTTTLLWRGLLSIALGATSVLWPSITIGAFVIVFAVFAFLLSAVESLRAFSSDRVGPVLGWLFLALIAVGAGCVALTWPGITALALTVCIGVWALMAGAGEIALGLLPGMRAGYRAFTTLTGLISIMLAFVLFARPDTGAVSLATVFGLFSLVHGVSTLVLSFQLRSRANVSPSAR